MTNLKFICVVEECVFNFIENVIDHILFCLVVIAGLYTVLSFLSLVCRLILRWN